MEGRGVNHALLQKEAHTIMTQAAADMTAIRYDDVERAIGKEPTEAQKSAANDDLAAMRKELSIMGRMASTLEALSPEARRRILSWLNGKFGA